MKKQVAPQRETMRELTDAELAQVSGGKIEQRNGGGKVPNGNANGVSYKNPAGNEPGGWNK